MRRLQDDHPHARPGPTSWYMGGDQSGPGALYGRGVVGMKSVKITLSRDPEDVHVWLASVVGHPGAQTFGRSLAEAKRHGLEAAALWFDVEPVDIAVDWDVRLGALAGPVKEARRAMAHAEADRLARDRAVRELTEAGISYRDVAELLGLSHQRVAQIAAAS